MKICPKCKTKYPDDKKYCKTCGVPLILAGQNPPKNKAGKQNLYFKLLPIILIIAIAVYFIISNFLSKNETDTDYIFKKDGELTFEDSTLSKIKTKIDIQIADNDYDRELGLMDRKQMDENRGMLFVFLQPQIQTFWMRNTFIPLDMIFIDSNKAIVTIAKNTKILSDQNYSSTSPAMYVLEVNAGFSDRFNIETGDKIVWIRTREHL